MYSGGRFIHEDKNSSIINPMNIQQRDNFSNIQEPKMDFSIFHGPGFIVAKKPDNVLYNSPLNQTYRQKRSELQEWNQGSDIRKQSFIQKQTHLRGEHFQHSKSNSSFSRSIIPEDVYRNSNITNNGLPSNNKMSLMPLPKPNNYNHFEKNQNSLPGVSNYRKTVEKSQKDPDQALKIRKFGESDVEKICILTGPVERVIKWGKIFQNHFCYFEVIASVISMANGKVTFENIILLRDKKGPILQVVYYSNATRVKIEDFYLGQMLRVVGRIIGPNIMSASTIREATAEEYETLPRMCHISDKAVSAICGNDF